LFSSLEAEMGNNKEGGGEGGDGKDMRKKSKRAKV
jgi:hypothetical protein